MMWRQTGEEALGLLVFVFCFIFTRREQVRSGNLESSGIFYRLIKCNLSEELRIENYEFMGKLRRRAL
jgi:hypothetical protein